MLTQCPFCAQKLNVPEGYAKEQEQTCPKCGKTLDALIPASPPQEPESRQPLVECPYCRERIPSVAASCPYCGELLDDEDPDDRPWDQPGIGFRRDAEPHRGGFVLGMGIASIVAGPLAFCCSIFGMIVTIPGLVMGIVAWRMANTDLKKMESGEMDPRGRATVQAGRVCGITGMILCAFASLGILAFVLFQSFMMYRAVPPPPLPPPVPPAAVIESKLLLHC